MESTPKPAQPKQRRANPLVSLLAAIQFLTIAPPVIRRPFTAGEMGQAVGFYPLVGLMIGGILLGADALLSLILPVQARAALVLALWVVLTGALHLDGFLDACDGLLGGYTPESRLQIMRDERVGAYALAGGILLLLIKFSALSGLGNTAAALLLAPTLGRWGMAVAVVAFPYARLEGLGRDVKGHATWRQAALAMLVALAVAGLAGGLWGLIAFGLAGLTVWVGARFALRRIPGLTGDIYGALNEIIEMVVLLTLLVGQGFGNSG
jgi:cobalamin 5'-phosphate synthase/cobalamin synthase